MPLAYTRRGPNRSASRPDTGSSTAINSAATVTAIRTGTRARCRVPVAYEMANTPHVLNAAPSPQRDSRPNNRGPQRRRTEYLTQRNGRTIVLGADLLERWCLGRLQSHDDTETDQHDADEERDASAVSLEGVVGQGDLQQCEYACAQSQSERQAYLRHAARQTPPMRWAVLYRQQNGACPFAAECKALHDPEQQQQRRGEHTDLRGGGQQSHQRRCSAHQEHGQREGLLSAYPVTDMAEHEAADRPDDESDGECCERQQSAGQRTLIRAERMVEDEAWRSRVQEEVLPLDGGSDEAGQQGGANPRIGSVIEGWRNMPGRKVGQ